MLAEHMSIGKSRIEAAKKLIQRKRLMSKLFFRPNKLIKLVKAGRKL